MRLLNFGKKFIYIICLTVIPFQLSLSAYSAYEIINAKTVGEILPDAEKNDNSIPTFNDPEIPNFSENNSVSAKIENKFRNFFDKRKNKKNLKQQDDIGAEVQNEEITEDTLQNDTSFRDASKTESVQDKNKFQVNADKITYDEEDGNVYAKGHVEIIANAQNLKLCSDEAVLDKTSQTLKLFDNVKVIKDNVEMTGEYLLVDLNEENILMDNPTVEAYSFKINAQEGYLIANDIQMINGTIKSNQQAEYALQTSGFQRIENVAFDYAKKRSSLRALSDTTRKQTYKIDAKEIVITSYKDHDSVIMKNSDIFYNKHKIIRNSDIEILSDREHQMVETNAPEAGTLRNFGTYIGYGLVYRLPHGQSFKIMPALVYGNSNIGVGAIGRYRTPNSVLEAGYATATTNLVARGRYKFSDHLALRYGRNAYLPEGFMGTRRSGYAAQLEYLRSYKVADLDAYFNHGVYAGIFSDYQEHKQEKAYATTRFRYIAELRKPFIRYQNKEQDLEISLNGLVQTAATLYGSGQTTGVIRVGPYLTTKLKFWESSLGYLFGGVHGDSPFIFDKYRYGKSSIMLNEKLNLTDKFALGFRAVVSPLKDNYEKDLLTESRLYAIFGPQDLKVAVSYDFVRDIAHVDFMFFVGSDSSKIDFEKLTTKDADGSQRKRDFYRRTKPVKVEDLENI